MRILIAGVGDLGSRLALAFADQAHQVVALSRRATSLNEVRCEAVDLRQRAALEPWVQNCELVYFCAAPGARDLASYQALYGDGLANLMHWRTTQRIVFCSSTSVYDQDHGAWVDEDELALGSNPLNGVLRRSELALKAGDCSVRLGGIYGPNRNFAQRQALAGVPARCGQWTNRIHIEDACTVLAAFAELPELPPVINLVDDRPCLQDEYYAWLRARAGLAALDCQGEHVESGKRVSNRRLRQLGIDLRYPDYRAAYG